MSVLTLGVRSVIRATPHTRILRLSLDDLRFPYRAGQSAALGIHGQPHRRPYSMSLPPEEAAGHGFLEFLLRVDARGYAGAHLAGLKRGARVDVAGPFGSFRFPAEPRERHFLFIAGGTGIAPLRAMLRHALLTGRPGRYKVLYSARSASDFAYLAELRRLQRAGRVDLVLTATRDTSLGWAGEHGRINLGRLARLIEDPATLCFLCGPKSLLEDVPPLLGRIGVAPARMHMETW